MKTWKEWACISPALLIAGVAGCSAGPENGNVGSDQEAVIGGALPGTNAADFADAVTNFKAVEGLVDGLGPIFNERSCGGCHTDGANGGAACKSSGATVGSSMARSTRWRAAAARCGNSFRMAPSTMARCFAGFRWRSSRRRQRCTTSAAW